MFFGHALRCVPFFVKEAAAVEINYLKDTLFDLINESDDLNVTDIQSDDKDNSFLVTVQDGSRFTIKIEKS